MSGALVSTIIPVWNRPSMLREAVASVLAQTYRPIEVVIVDDGSTDDTGAVADALAREHRDVVRAIHVANGGPGAAREAGRRIARGDLVQYLDSDDVLLPRKFELQVAALAAHPECGAAYGRTREYGTSGPARKRTGDRIDAMFPSMLNERWWDTPTPLYRAAVLAAAGPWTALRAEEDWEYDCRIAALGVRLAFCDDWVCEVRIGAPGHLSMRTDAATLRDRARAHLLVLEHARRGGLDTRSPEMRTFARALFHLARQCGAAGLRSESRQLVAAARALAPSADVLAYQLAARVAGTRAAGVLSAALDRLRERRR